MIRSRSFGIGLGLLAVVSVLDVPLPLLTDGRHPPMSVAVADCVLGLASLALVASAWRGARRVVPPLLALRALSAVSAVPALFISDAPSAAKVAAVAVVMLNVVGAALVVSDRHASISAGAR